MKQIILLSLRPHTIKIYEQIKADKSSDFVVERNNKVVRNTRMVTNSEGLKEKNDA